MEAATGFEPVVKVLQTSALPLGYAAEYYGAEDGIRTRDPHLGKVVFYHWTTSAYKKEMVRVKGVEPPRLAAPDPKSGASANSATPAFYILAV